MYLEPTPANIKRAKEFIFEKWKERAAKLGRDEPEDLTNSCKFSSLFAKKIFGGEIRGNYDHVHVVKNKKIIDLNEDASDVKHFISEWGRRPTYSNDKSFINGREFKYSIGTCENIVNKWVEEFLGRYKNASRNILYHYTKLSGLKSILATDTLKATQIEGDKYLGVSLTRDPRLSFHEEGGPVRIILDGNKLNQRYKIKPFSFYGGRSNEVDSDNQTYSEEVLLGDIKNLGQYILSVNLETENKAALQALEKYKDKYGLSFKVSYGFDSFRYNPSSTTKVKNHILDRDNRNYEKSKDLFNKEYAKFKRLYSIGALSGDEVLDKIEYLSFNKDFSYYWNRQDLIKFQEFWENKLESPGSQVKKSYVSKDLSMLYNYLKKSSLKSR